MCTFGLFLTNKWLKYLQITLSLCMDLKYAPLYLCQSLVYLESHFFIINVLCFSKSTGHLLQQASFEQFSRSDSCINKYISILYNNINILKIKIIITEKLFSWLKKWLNFLWLWVSYSSGATHYSLEVYFIPVVIFTTIILYIIYIVTNVCYQFTNYVVLVIIL